MSYEEAAKPFKHRKCVKPVNEIKDYDGMDNSVRTFLSQLGFCERCLYFPEKFTVDMDDPMEMKYVAFMMVRDERSGISDSFQRRPKPSFKMVMNQIHNKHLSDNWDRTIVVNNNNMHHVKFLWDSTDYNVPSSDNVDIMRYKEAGHFEAFNVFWRWTPISFAFMQETYLSIAKACMMQPGKFYQLQTVGDNERVETQNILSQKSHVCS